MKSIDRLREYVENAPSTSMGITVRATVADLAAAIEREAKANRVDAYTKGYDEGFASADDWAAQHEDAMAEHGWVRLPVDADGVPIHVGDVMEWPGSSTAEVVGIGDDRFFYADDGLRYAWASDKIHHHAPTVEDVLREFAAEVETAGGVMELPDAALAEFAARLTLRGDE